MTIKVYHATNRENWQNFDFDSMALSDSLAQKENRPDLYKMAKENPSLFILQMGYELVATVDADNLSYAFEKTNTINWHWWENEAVTLEGLKTRSTSIGDLMVHDNKCYVVDRAGFQLLGQP